MDVRLKNKNNSVKNIFINKINKEHKRSADLSVAINHIQFYKKNHTVVNDIILKGIRPGQNTV